MNRALAGMRQGYQKVRSRRWGSGLNSPIGLRFTSKLRVAFAGLLLINLFLAWYFFDTVTWYEHDLKAIEAEDEALHGLQHTRNLVTALVREIGDPSTVPAADGANDRIDRLQENLEALRSGFSQRLFLNPGNGVGSTLNRLAELERTIDRIVQAHVEVMTARGAGDEAAAADARSRFQGSGLVDLLEELMTAEVEVQRHRVHALRQQAIDLAVYIASILPLFAIGLTIVCLLVIAFFSRSLIRSVHALRTGAIAFREGDLQYRIPELPEKEFRGLGEAFNRMARELADHRTTLHDTNIKLEATVDERTRALQASNERLASIDDNRRKLLADISHEFRTPLTVIQGEAEIALRGKRKPVAHYRESLVRIQEQARQTTRLVEDLLFIARAEVGEPRLQFEPCDLSTLLREVCDHFAAPAAQREVRIEPVIPEEPCDVMADRGRLRQVFTILLDNAVRYSGEGSLIDVELRCEEREAVISVGDRGIGLTREEASEVFERFYRGRRASSRESGSGLGLPVARAIVEAHRGSITLQPRDGGGALARIRLPLGS